MHTLPQSQNQVNAHLIYLHGHVYVYVYMVCGCSHVLCCSMHLPLFLLCLVLVFTGEFHS